MPPQDRVLLGDSRGEESGIYSLKDLLWPARRDQQTAGLTEEEKEMVAELKARDQEVRTHEQAHAAALGRYMTRGPTYSYQVGPDGRAYAVGGSVEADIGPEATPEATAAKALILRQAAMGVDAPSASDMAVAMSAMNMGFQAVG